MGKIDHPKHYNTGKIEVIDFIEDKDLGFHLGNVVKYICRAGKKDGEDEIDDIDKAIWYLERYRNLLKKEKGTLGEMMLLDKGKVICKDINSDVGKSYLSEMMKDPAFAQKYLDAMSEQTMWELRHSKKDEGKKE